MFEKYFARIRKEQQGRAARFGGQAPDKLAAAQTTTPKAKPKSVSGQPVFGHLLARPTASAPAAPAASGPTFGHLTAGRPSRGHPAASSAGGQLQAHTGEFSHLLGNQRPAEPRGATSNADPQVAQTVARMSAVYQRVTNPAGRAIQAAPQRPAASTAEQLAANMQQALQRAAEIEARAKPTGKQVSVEDTVSQMRGVYDQCIDPDGARAMKPQGSEKPGSVGETVARMRAVYDRATEPT